MEFLVGRRVVALAFILSAAVAAGACTYNEAEGKGGKQGKGSNVCYERVLDVDKETGKAHYEDRQVPCKK
jgi:hypothetical protein